MQTATESHAHSEQLQLVGFQLGQEEFALDILRVQEIIRTQQLTRVPNLPDYIDGVINLRGKVIPVIKLRRRLGLESSTTDKNTRIVVVDVHGQVLGFVVDAVSQVIRMSSEVVEPTPRLGRVERDYVSGVGKIDDRLLLLLDLDKLMDQDEAEQAEAAAEAAPVQ
jgi:purine-binding chemotaxis protein CheW